MQPIGLCRDDGEVRCRSQTGLQGQERWPAGCAQGGARKVEDGWHGSTRAHAGDGSMQWQPGPFWETCLKACNCVREHSCMIMRYKYILQDAFKQKVSYKYKRSRKGDLNEKGKFYTEHDLKTVLKLPRALDLFLSNPACMYKVAHHTPNVIGNPLLFIGNPCLSEENPPLVARLIVCNFSHVKVAR